MRYGVYLRPDAATCWAVTQITDALRRQFGLVSAGTFPPHATLVGNLATKISEVQLVRCLDPVFEGIEPFAVYNSGIERTRKNTFEYNVNLDSAGCLPNEALGKVARTVLEAVLPVSSPVEDTLTVSVEDYRFAGHLGLASHELGIDDRLSDEVGEFLEELPVVAPRSFTVRYFTLFEFVAEWDTHWWEDLRWRHIKSWDIV